MKAINIFEDLKGNAYPGRGIVTGQSQDGRYAVAAYFIMGRSVNSRNRIFVTEGENMRTQAHDPALLSDPSLVIYYPVRTFAGGLIVTNGDQTDTIHDYIAAHPDCPVSGAFQQALLTRTYEPDPPIYTPFSRADRSGRGLPPPCASSSTMSLCQGWGISSTPTNAMATRCPPLRGSPRPRPSPGTLTALQTACGRA